VRTLPVREAVRAHGVACKATCGPSAITKEAVPLDGRWHPSGAAGGCPSAAGHMGIGPVEFFKRIELELIWRREFARVRAELTSYSERQISADLRMNGSDIPGIAREAADQHLATFVRSRPSYRGAWERRTGSAAVGWAG
jgi:hypothetical protein